MQENDMHPKIKQFMVVDEEENTRVDQWFKKKFPTISFVMLMQLLRKGIIRVNNGRKKQDYRLQTGDLITIRKSVIDGIKSDEKPKKILNIDRRILDWIIYEDQNMLAINKPSGVAVQGGIGIKTSVDEMLNIFRCNGKKAKLVHRIDKYTTGLLIIAKNDETATELSRMFSEEGSIIKHYLALCHGVPKEKKGVISIPLCNIRWYQNREHVGYHPIDGKRAVTEYEVQEVNSAKTLSLIKFRIFTGRKHQIRAHAAMSGIPVLGDNKYNRESTQWWRAFDPLTQFSDDEYEKYLLDKKDGKIPRILSNDEYAGVESKFPCLHSASISMTLYGKKIDITAKLHQYFLDMLEDTAIASNHFIKAFL